MSTTHTYIGTSGWSYPTGFGKWAGIVYPKRWRGDELAFYAERFPSVEVNVSFYRVPTPEMVTGWLQRTPPHFRFAVKLYRKFTHPDFYFREEGKSPAITPDDVQEMRQVLDPIAEEGKLGALLVQYPEFFQRQADTTASLERTLKHFHDYPLAVELRHASWGDPHTTQLLDSFAAARVRIDEPFFENLNEPASATASIDYWRFHGRNTAAWKTPGAGHHRYDYYYSTGEVAQLASSIKQHSTKGRSRFVYFNNHVSGMAFANAALLAADLEVDLPFDKFSHLAQLFPDLRPLTGNPGGQLNIPE